MNMKDMQNKDCRELRNCPFCGGEVYFTTMYVGNGGEEHCIACEGCDMLFTIDWLSPDKEDLAAFWNRRANDA